MQVTWSVVTWSRGHLVWKEASVFVFDKKVADKLHKPRRREVVTDMLRNEVSLTSRLKHPSVLRVIHALEESK